MTSKEVTIVLILLVALDWFLLQSSVHGVVTIFPTQRAAVCRVGDRLEVICNTTGSTTLTWSLAIIGATNSISRTLSTTTQSPKAVPIDSTTLVFSRVSELSELPLVSRLIINNIGQSLNGTIITCMESGLAALTATTTVYIYGDYQHNPPDVDFEEVFEEERVIIHLNWTQSENSLLSFDVSVVPGNGTTVSITDSTRANITLAYNIPYNVTIMADFCGANTLIKFSYAKCVDPFEKLSHNDSGSLRVQSYTNSRPVLEGDEITFSCISGMELVGPNSITCMGNGEWEPNPREVECKANCGPPSLPDGGYIIPYTSTLEGMEVTYICQSTTAVCTKMGYWEPNSSDICAFDINTTGPSSSEVLSQNEKIAAVSSVTVFVITSILFFIVGFLCGYFCQKKRKTNDQSTPLYGDVQPKQYEQELELKANVAYGHVHVVN